MASDDKQLTPISKFLSLVLRHKPETIGLALDEQGWADVDTLLRLLNKHGKHVDRELLNKVVETNSKKRFAFNADGSKIRASQGHSIEVELGYKPQKPPMYLYHGTAAQHVDSIYASGLQKRERHHVHLSPDRQTAIQVGQRHGKPVVFRIRAEDMHQQGFVFYESDNGVWLTEHVPISYMEKE